MERAPRFSGRGTWCDGKALVLDAYPGWNAFYADPAGVASVCAQDPFAPSVFAQMGRLVFAWVALELCVRAVVQAAWEGTHACEQATAGPACSPPRRCAGRAKPSFSTTSTLSPTACWLPTAAG